MKSDNFSLMHSFLLALIVFVGFLHEMREPAAMIRKIVYSSPIEGFITKDGKPLKAQVVSRIVRGDGLPKQGEKDFAHTDEAGLFYFNAVEKRSMFKPNFPGAVPVALLELETELEGETYTLFFKNKMNFDLGGEGYGVPFRISCELNNYEIFGQYRAVNCQLGEEALIRK